MSEYQFGISICFSPTTYTHLPSLEICSLCITCTTEAAENFHYTNQGDAVELEDVSDSDEFAATQEALSLLGLSTKLRRSLLRVLAAILQLGNITISQKDDDSQIKVDNPCTNTDQP